MSEKLMKLSLAVSILGIFFLLFLSTTAKPKSVSSYQELKLNEYVKTQGKIISIKSYDDFNIINLDNNLTITCNCNFQINSTIQAQGKVAEYKNQLQISVNKILITEQ